MIEQKPTSKKPKSPLGNATNKTKNNKSVEEIYQKKTQLEHILLRPDTYVGSCERAEEKAWVYDAATKSLTHKQVSFVPGLYKIFDEILVNATDNKVRDPKMKELRVDIDVEQGLIRVYNDGNGIPVEMHKDEGVYVPELIFGHLLTSSNYDDNEKKVVGGRNGYGAKLANIFSTEFIVETCDGSRGKRYRQVFKNNMSVKGEPELSKCKKSENWTCITFKPDFEKFGMESLVNEDVAALMCKRVYDAAGNIGKNTNIYLNGEKLEVKGFSDYVSLYLDGQANAPKIFEKTMDRWEVCVTISDTAQFQQCSFVNGICTMKGGTHVNSVADQISQKLLEKIQKKEKSCKNLKAFQVKNHLWVFVNALIENPAFDSQTKETLITRPNKFGSAYAPSDAIIKKLMESGVVDNIMSWAQFKQSKELKKTDGAKRSRLTGIPKLDDANDAGGRNSESCTLILTEGDSAKALAVSGLSVVGRDKYGVFPLRGKLLNVRDASHEQIKNNTEINHIKQILGLQHGKEYDSAKSLRYGKLMIMTDQDHDGSHIKGLLINFLHAHFPSLLKIPGFLLEFITPIIKATKGKQSKVFYTMPEYEAWKEANDGTSGWSIKYYKGLGTSTANEAKEYFASLDHHRKSFVWQSDGDGDLIDMSFSKKRVVDRKAWLTAYEPGTFLDMTGEDIRYDEFINKELILFSRADLLRSIPSMVDGFKPSQRKVLFSCFKRKLKSDIKVAQLSGYVSEHSAYHHGEASLAMTIVNLAQDFVGSNNINLLVPSGQFGTRLQGGKDHASPRYIFTRLHEVCRAMFPECDDALLNYLDEDGQRIEPDYYYPVLPLVLVNGAEGIGTGWSTSIPNFNPRDLIANIRLVLEGESPVQMHPWYRHFKGSITEELVKGETRYNVTGSYNIRDECTLEVTELPLRSWTSDYKEFLEEMLVPKTKTAKPFITDYKEYHTDSTVHFVITMPPENLAAAQASGIEKKFKLSTKLNITNMHLFNEQGVITKYSSPVAILEAFVPLRLKAYSQRREMLIRLAESQLKRLSNKMRFILAVVDGSLVVNRKKKQELIAELEALCYDRLPKTDKGSVAELDEDGEFIANDVAGSYDYLLGMPLWNLTLEKVDELCAEKEAKEAEVAELHKTTEKDLWMKDLDTLEQTLELLDAEDEESRIVLEKQQRAAARNNTAAGKKAAKKKMAKQRAANSSDEDEWDDDFSDDDFEIAKPKKAAAKPEAAAKPKAAPVPAPAPVAKVESEDEETEPMSLAERLALRGGAALSKPAAAKPASAFNMSSINAAVDDVAISKPAPAKKSAAPKRAPAKKAAVASDSEEDFGGESDSEVVAPVAPRSTARPARARTAKTYVVDDSDDSEDDVSEEDDDDDDESDFSESE